ncbi:hypothetical protein IFM89_025099 [Coptis chinensis]|uniref:Uncharacterized protein n=1 Tax=Coptis chinensis TaxID=261450 RepID=A0A835HT13_9MAGN|nr:hypothetical protein IFM89_025099 [Coptis chinensis]
MAAVSSPSSLTKDNNSMSTSPVFSPTSEKQYWSDLRNRVDTLLDLQAPSENGGLGKRKRLRKEDCLLLLRGFDSISSSLSHLTSNLDTAMHGARELAKPSLTEALHCDQEKTASDEVENKRGVKRKTNLHESSNDQEDHEEKEKEQSLESGKLKKAKNLAISMATKAATLARELRSMKSNFSFMQERCSMLEEENRRLKEGYGKGMRPEEDDLVRLQLEALLAEKSRLANENANLTRENECLHQLVEYHQVTSQDLSPSYEQVINGMCLDFSSPPPSIAEEANAEGDSGDFEAPQTPRTDTHGISTSLDGWLGEEKKDIE